MFIIFRWGWRVKGERGGAGELTKGGKRSAAPARKRERRGGIIGLRHEIGHAVSEGVLHGVVVVHADQHAAGAVHQGVGGDAGDGAGYDQAAQGSAVDEGGAADGLDAAV